MDASCQFPRFKGFCKIVVRSNLQTDNAIHRLTHRAEKQERHFGRHTQCFQKLQSRSTRKHDIKHDQCVLSLESSGQAGSVVVSGINRKPFRCEELPQKVNQVMIVINNENLIHRSKSFLG